MGQERECRLRLGGKSYRGQAWLETDFLLFRGEVRIKTPFSEMKKIAADGGWLKFESKDGPIALELGPAAEKWAEKILHPPSRLDKLGIKPGLRIALEGDFDADFSGEIGPAVKSDADLLFLSANRKADLAKIETLKRHIKAGGAIWVVYPKGKTEIREIEVIQAGRAAGLKDTKVARFSETHTALRFSLPK